MSASILVGYATRYGSTKEVAEAIAATLRDAGLEVKIRPLGEIDSFEGYHAVVLAAPLYMGGQSKDESRFLERHHAVLSEQPVALFALGPLGASDEKEWQDVRAMLEQQVTKFPWLALVAMELFGDKYDPATLRLPDNPIARLPASPLPQRAAGDADYWTAIRAWASQLAAQLQPARL
jgi:menaquinone-dependent protoporphyrinogen oxidase